MKNAAPETSQRILDINPQISSEFTGKRNARLRRLSILDFPF
jgi:hypothetical protein